uniref:Phlebovirus glycoprotein G2 fusion domain-containing protein n=1 Tax=Ascaris lumbricoides TaxID=6252 RepID=A0A0M3IAI6_ASCLU
MLPIRICSRIVHERAKQRENIAARVSNGAAQCVNNSTRAAFALYRAMSTTNALRSHVPSAKRAVLACANGDAVCSCAALELSGVDDECYVHPENCPPTS